jgi:hypothetical protein
MPAVSKKQRQAMAIAEKVKSGEMKAKPGSPSAEMAKSMTHEQLHDFAATKEKGLPAHKKKKKVRRPGAGKLRRVQRED